MLRRTSHTGIPLWVNLMQVVLIAIMTVQVFEHFFDHDAITAMGWPTDGDPSLNLVYEMGARLTVMVAASLFVMVTQDPRQYLVVLLMNVVREAMEGVIDPLWPVADAPASPIVDFSIHVVIVAIELAALVTVARVAMRDGRGLLGRGGPEPSAGPLTRASSHGAS